MIQQGWHNAIHEGFWPEIECDSDQASGSECWFPGNTGDRGTRLITPPGGNQPERKTACRVNNPDSSKKKKRHFKREINDIFKCQEKRGTVINVKKLNRHSIPKAMFVA